MRIGHGYDVHRLAAGRRLILGGVEIHHVVNSSTIGLLGHSDADVLLHAIMDALLGAAALGDIGQHFPNTSDEFKDISSLVLLNRVYCILKEHNLSVTNIDCTIICQAPKLAPFIPKMAENIRNTLCMAEATVNIKATTEEGLGFTGSNEGIAAHAVVLIITQSRT